MLDLFLIVILSILISYTPFLTKILLETFKKKGSTAISMHLGIFNIPVVVAKKFKIPLIVWGENLAAEYGYKKKKHIVPMIISYIIRAHLE